MPIYNGIEYIDESVSSILAQTYTEWELIIGVNGHEPMSIVYLIARKYEKRANIRVLDLHNIRGKSNALNEMMKTCKYDYVALLDVDDIWEPSKLMVQSEYMNKYDVIGTNCVYFGNKNVVPKLPLGDLKSFDFFDYNPIINSSVLIRKELCWWNQIYDGIEDYELWLRLKKNGKNFYNVTTILIKHRIHLLSAFNTRDHSAQINEIKRIHR
jgi:teichuronic acid biosynthesis glycosyltransferase TuaG